MQQNGLTKTPVINGNEDENVSACLCLLWNPRVLFESSCREAFQELGTLVCPGNYNSPSRRGCSGNQAQTLTVSGDRSKNEGRIQELVASLSSNASCGAVRSLFQGRLLRKSGFERSKAGSLQGKISFFCECRLFAPAEAQCLLGGFEL